MGHRERTEAWISEKESKIFANLLQEAEQKDTEKIWEIRPGWTQLEETTFGDCRTSPCPRDQAVDSYC